MGYEQEPKSVDYQIPDISAFFAESNSNSKLVWCADTLEDIDAIKREAKERNLEVEVNCKDLTLIRSMSSMCFIVTDESLMRGIDYRLKKTTGSFDDGIDLLVMRSFSS